MSSRPELPSSATPVPAFPGIASMPKRRDALIGALGLAAASMAGGSVIAAPAAPAAASAASASASASEPQAQPRSGQRRVDVHTHYLPEKYRSALEAAGHGKPSGMPGIPKWSTELALGTMDRLDIETGMLSISAPGVHFGDDAAARKLARYVNEEGAKAVSAHPRRFGLFATLPLPEVDGALKEIEHAFNTLHADGVVMESNYHGVYLGDARLEPVFAELNRRRATLFIHPANPHCPCCQDPAALPPLGQPFPMLEFMFETTRAVFNLVLSGTLERFRDLKVIVPHAGATVPVLADRVQAVAGMLGLAHPPLDAARFSQTLRTLYYDLAGFAEPVQLSALLQIADPAHILYGSDWPFTPEPIVAALAKKLDGSRLMTPALQAAFMRDNAVALFPRLGRA